MKILTAIPVIYCNDCIRLTVQHLEKQTKNTDIFFIDNGSSPDIKETIKNYPKIVNEKNIYVNPAWNQILKYFIESDYDMVIILNSDLFMKSDVIEKLCELDIEKNKIIPYLTPVNMFTNPERVISQFPQGRHSSGAFIPLTKNMAKIVYPLPEDIKIWFGDNWIFEKLKTEGYEQKVYNDMQCQHMVSVSINSLPEANGVINNDIEIWNKKYAPMLKVESFVR